MEEQRPFGAPKVVSGVGTIVLERVLSRKGDPVVANVLFKDNTLGIEPIQDLINLKPRLTRLHRGHPSEPDNRIP